MSHASLLADDSKSFHDEARTTLELNPNSPYAVGSIGYSHILRGGLDPGLPLLNRAIAMNPCHSA